MVQDHPRLRGKDLVRGYKSTVSLGSPPLARERLLAMKDKVAAVRITPACAGKTSIPKTAPIRLQDHPRLRGKDSFDVSQISHVAGSPPLARERPAHSVTKIVTVRITPACAGKTSTRKFYCVFCQDHPRLRGKDINR